MRHCPYSCHRACIIVTLGILYEQKKTGKMERSTQHLILNRRNSNQLASQSIKSNILSVIVLGVVESVQ